MELTPQLVVALGGCAIAVYTDVKSGKIFNALTGPMMVLGLVMNASLGLWEVGVYGFVVATVLHYGLWRFGVQKGGDAKLMMAIGALLGWRFMLETSFYYALIYLPTGLLVLWYRGRLSNLFRTVSSMTSDSDEEKPEPTYLITAPVIAAALVVASLL